MSKTAKQEAARRNGIKRPKKARQQHLPGLEPPSIKAIDEAAETYYETMMERVELSKKETEAMDNLIEKMIAEKLTRYETPDGLIVTATSKTKCAVKKKPKAEEEGDDGDA